MAGTLERNILAGKGEELFYGPEEKIGVIVVNSFPRLGTLSALRFLEWAGENPRGVVALPTGRTPEYFIKETKRFLDGWEDREVRAELEAWGLDGRRKPATADLRLVQIDEFYPLPGSRHNSFYHYVNTYYIETFGLDPRKALLINCDAIPRPPGKSLSELWPDGAVDLSLRTRAPESKLEEVQREAIRLVDQWCVEYEDRVREAGGIGFFLGGIGPDGHIGFNIRGSNLHSTTRLTGTNYETQAASAPDLGGMEAARKYPVITIGLETITFNRECVALIIAAGEAKANIVNRAITAPRDVKHPATALRVLPHARFYLTDGAAKNLELRRQRAFEKKSDPRPDEIEAIVVEVSLKTGKRVQELTASDYGQTALGSLLLEKTPGTVAEINRAVRDSLIAKIEAGMKTDREKRFLHTEPHDDDIMLGYLPFVARHIRERTNRHFIATFTSGFTSVTNAYMLDLCLRLKKALKEDAYGYRALKAEGYFAAGENPAENRDVWRYLDGVAARSEALKEDGRLRRFLRNLIDVHGEDYRQLETELDALSDYFQTQYPGDKDPPRVQRLKGNCREWESACMWGHFGWSSDSIEHLRLGFYRGDTFTEEPTLQRDVEPIVKLLNAVKPDVITVALDPEASGPDTHYKVLQAVSGALKLFDESRGRGSDPAKIEVIGYRNVWYRFEPHEANLFVPVSLNMLTLQYEAFMNSYISQKDASYPSYELDGPFPLLAQKIQVENYQRLKVCLGDDFFYDHPSALIRAARGFVFAKRMNLDDFYTHSRQLRSKTENY